MVISDFNQGQYSDIAVFKSGTNNNGIFLGYGNGTFLSLVTSSPVLLSVVYYDNDIHLDVAVANFGNNNVCILFCYGNGSFGHSMCRTPGYDSRPYAVVSGDVNGDNMTDVIIANWGSSTIEIFTKMC